jgi:hypothetical protein
MLQIVSHRAKRMSAFRKRKESANIAARRPSGVLIVGCVTPRKQVLASERMLPRCAEPSGR